MDEDGVPVEIVDDAAVVLTVVARDDDGILKLQLLTAGFASACSVCRVGCCCCCAPVVISELVLVMLLV